MLLNRERKTYSCVDFANCLFSWPESFLFPGLQLWHRERQVGFPKALEILDRFGLILLTWAHTKIICMICVVGLGKHPQCNAGLLSTSSTIISFIKNVCLYLNHAEKRAKKTYYYY